MESTPTATAEFPAERIHAAHRQAVIVTGAIGLSLVVYAVVVEVLRRTLPPPVPVQGIDSLRIVLFVFVGVIVFTATVVKGIFLRRAPSTGEARLARLRAAAVLSAAFAELPAVLGLVLFTIDRLRSDFYILLVVALYMLVRHFPQREAWETYVRRGDSAR